MTTEMRKSHALRLLALLAVLPITAAAQMPDLDLRLPWDIDAESTSYDGKTQMIIFSGLRLSQGRVGIEADEGRATNAESEDGSWQFSGNVVIDIQNGHIECDAADLKFEEYQLKHATVTGSPATFELKRPGSDEPTFAEAGRLSYDVDSGIIEFSDQAMISEGGNQFSSDFLVYNITEQRINAESSESGEGRVRITYTPTNGAAADEATDAESPVTDNESPKPADEDSGAEDENP